MSEKERTIGNSDNGLNTHSKEVYKDSSKVSEENTYEKYANIIQKYLKVMPENKVLLEVGIGIEGGMLLHLKNNNEVFGVDVSDSAISNCNKFGIKVFKKNLDVDKLNEFEDNYFDIIFAFEVFEHFSNPQHAIEEIKRVLKENGKLIISIPNVYTYDLSKVFYPQLFEKENFYEFLLMNFFECKISDDNFALNRYSEFKTSTNKKVENIFYLCEELSSNDSEKYFQSGLHFWHKKDEDKIRTCPMQAVELFRKSYEANPNTIMYKLYFTHALIYRAIYGDSEEFLQLINFLLEDIDSFENEDQIKVIKRIILIIIESLKLNYIFFDKELLEKLLNWLTNNDRSKANINEISNEIVYVMKYLDIDENILTVFNNYLNIHGKETQFDNFEIKKNDPDTKKCKICGANSELYYKNQRNFFLCPECKLIFSEDLTDYDYQENHYTKQWENQSDEFWSKTTDTLIQITKGYISPKKIMDYGAGSGGLTNELKKRKYEVTPIDPITTGYLSDHNFSNEFDTIFAIEVVEHLSDPLSEFKLLSKALRKGGVLVLSTLRTDEFLDIPDGKSIFHNWWYKDDLTHVSFFNQSSLSKIGILTGFSFMAVYGAGIAILKK